MDKFQLAYNWFKSRDWKPFPFQTKTWKHFASGRSGFVNAPTGSGKTYSLMIPAILEILAAKGGKHKKVRLLWFTPMRSLANEIKLAAERFIKENELDATVGIRNGDTSTSQRKKQKEHPPDILIITPESVHILMAQKNYHRYFNSLQAIVVDEWHELIGSKRGVLVELALSRLSAINEKLKIWGISATVGNMQEAMDVLLSCTKGDKIFIRSSIKKKINVEPVIPDNIEILPWAGHLGIKLIEHAVPIINNSESTLIFTNTRAQSEIWYQRLLEVCPDLAGQMALHHGSISKKLRLWVEYGLRTKALKVVVCTSSLDLGVDFAPVDTVIQIGSPKGVARFLQRAGRSGHQPGSSSTIHFLPTHALELLEVEALKQAIRKEEVEAKTPVIRAFDVLIQYLVTLAVSDGFKSEQLYEEIRRTYCFASISEEEWQWVLNFIVHGAQSLDRYDEYKKVEIDKESVFRVTNRRIAYRHRLNIGTIVSDAMMNVKPKRGKKYGVVEEWFVTHLKPGDIFWFSGRCLQLEKVKNNDIIVKKVKPQKGKVPSWQGGRMPLSTQLGNEIRNIVDNLAFGRVSGKAIKALKPVLEAQTLRSELPNKHEFLIEQFESKEGHHTLFYPFDGRFVHEAMANLVSYRISNQLPITFSVTVNDYGFELLSDQKIPEELLSPFVFDPDDLFADIERAMNATEIARRNFRDIAVISGLVFNGFPGKPKKDRHLQASSQLFFTVFRDMEPDNLLFKQAIEETFNVQIEETRLREALSRICQLQFKIVQSEKPTPFAFPIMVDRLRVTKISSESLEDRIKKMQIQFS